MLAFLALLAQTQAMDSTYERLIREMTTDTLFLPASVASIPHDPNVPSPLDYFGTIAGAEGVMHRSGELYGYYRALAEASPRVRLEQIGTTEEGRPIMLVTVADETLLNAAADNKRLLTQLADPRATAPAEAQRILDDAIPVYYTMGGLHSPEMGPPAHARRAKSVPEVGLEPTRPDGRGLLRALRMPIPPLRRRGASIPRPPGPPNLAQLPGIKVEEHL